MSMCLNWPEFKSCTALWGSTIPWPSHLAYLQHTHVTTPTHRATVTVRGDEWPKTTESREFNRCIANITKKIKPLSTVALTQDLPPLDHDFNKCSKNCGVLDHVHNFFRFISGQSCERASALAVICTWGTKYASIAGSSLSRTKK